MKYTYEELQIIADEFESEKYIKLEESLELLRQKFVQDYPADKIHLLSLDEYVCGLKMTGHDSYATFCYRIETELQKLGNMKGGFADKFGVYLSQEDGQYKFTKKYGNTLEEAFSDVKYEIEQLLHAGAMENLKAIEKSKIANLFKYKILATYYPTVYLPIFNEDHLDEFLNKLDISYFKKDAYTEKQRKLRSFKDTIPEMKDWSLYVYMRFLYDSIGIDSQQKRKDEEKQKSNDDKYPKALRSNIQISTSKWSEMLDRDAIFSSEDIKFMCQLYEEENHASTCKLIAIKNGVSPSSYIPLTVHLAKRVLSYLGRQPETRPNGKPRYWNVLFWGRDLDDGTFEWKLRPQLADALLKKFPDLGSASINASLDEGLGVDLGTNEILPKPKYQISRDKPEPVIIRGVQAYPRNRMAAMEALNNAKHKCEINQNHDTFIRKVDGLPYTEPHHLIPMAAQGDFEVSIDVPENIVSLCSNCHNEIHYGRNSRELIERLYNDRVHLLEANGISISLNQLLEYYGLVKG